MIFAELNQNSLLLGEKFAIVTEIIALSSQGTKSSLTFISFIRILFMEKQTNPVTYSVKWHLITSWLLLIHVIWEWTHDNWLRITEDNSNSTQLNFRVNLISKLLNSLYFDPLSRNLLRKLRKKKEIVVMWNGKFATEVRKSNLKQASVLEALTRLWIYFIPDQWIKFVQQFNSFFSFL